MAQKRSQVFPKSLMAKLVEDERAEAFEFIGWDREFGRSSIRFTRVWTRLTMSRASAMALSQYRYISWRWREGALPPFDTH